MSSKDTSRPPPSFTEATEEGAGGREREREERGKAVEDAYTARESPAAGESSSSSFPSAPALPGTRESSTPLAHEEDLTPGKTKRDAVCSSSSSSRLQPCSPPYLHTYPLVVSSSSSSVSLPCQPVSPNLDGSARELHVPPANGLLSPSTSSASVLLHSKAGLQKNGGLRASRSSQPVDVLMGSCIYRQQDFFLSPPSSSSSFFPSSSSDVLSQQPPLEQGAVAPCPWCPPCFSNSPVFSSPLVSASSPQNRGNAFFLRPQRRDSLPPVNRSRYEDSAPPPSLRPPSSSSSSPPWGQGHGGSSRSGRGREGGAGAGGEGGQNTPTADCSGSFSSGAHPARSPICCGCFPRRGRRRRGSWGSDLLFSSSSSPPSRSLSSSSHTEWNNRLTFVIATIGAAVGIGCVWRFPTYCYKFGGGIFLVPYFLMVFLLGIPLHTLEMSLGQVFRGGQMKVLNLISPRLRGLASATILQAFFICAYYSVFLAWGVLYIFSCFHSNLPWTLSQQDLAFCNALASNREACSQGGSSSFSSPSPSESSSFSSSAPPCLWIPYHQRSLSSSSSTHPAALGVVAEGGQEEEEGKTGRGVCVADVRARAKDYFFTDILGSSLPGREGGEEGAEGSALTLSGYVVLCLLVVWMQIYFSLFKGLQSLTCVIYAAVILPVVSMVVVMVSSLTLEGSWAGLKYLFIFDWRALVDRPEIWGEAASQVFFSLGVFQGVMTAYASHKKKLTQNTLVDTLIVSGCNTVLSLISAVCTFAIAGHVAERIGSVDPDTGLADLSSINLKGSELVFILYPISLSALPFIPQLFCLLFFIAFSLLGITSAISFVQPVIGLLMESKRFGPSSSSSSASLCSSSLSTLSSTSSPSLSSSSSRSRWKLMTLVICLLGFLFGLPFCTKTGIFLIDTADYHWSVIGITFIGACECIAFGWIYGLNRQIQCLGGGKASLPVLLHAFSYLGGVLLAAVLLFIVPPSAVVSTISQSTYVTLSLLVSISLVLAGSALALYFCPSVVLYQKTPPHLRHGTTPGPLHPRQALPSRTGRGEGEAKAHHEGERDNTQQDTNQSAATASSSSSLQTAKIHPSSLPAPSSSSPHPGPVSSFPDASANLPSSDRRPCDQSISASSSLAPQPPPASSSSSPPVFSSTALTSGYCPAELSLKTRMYWLYIGNIEHLRLNLNAITASNSRYLYLYPFWSVIIKYISPAVLMLLLFHELGRGGSFMSVGGFPLAYQAAAVAVLLFVVFVVFLGFAFPRLFDGLVPHERRLEPRMIIVSSDRETARAKQNQIEEEEEERAGEREGETAGKEGREDRDGAVLR